CDALELSQWLRPMKDDTERADTSEGLLSRWSQRKAQHRSTTVTKTRESEPPPANHTTSSQTPREALADVPDATAIITNPTHFAVALKYVPGEMRAPVILAMGRGKMAERIIEKGAEHGVTVFRSPLLARALYFTGDIGQEITDGVYTAVAAVLAYVFRLDRGENPEEPWVDIPDELQFDEHGKALNGEI
uniref:EscU/YscU/HrcU family type III secretion system export apparatus switch protein n=1 Tax=uncultured Lentibacter sp. TaxID=1659309 RepID=UPI00261B048E